MRNKWSTQLILQSADWEYLCREESGMSSLPMLEHNILWCNPEHSKGKTHAFQKYFLKPCRWVIPSWVGLAVSRDGMNFSNNMEIALTLPWLSWENFKQWFTLLLSGTAGLCLGGGDQNKNSISQLLMIWLNMCSILSWFLQCAGLAFYVNIPVPLIDRVAPTIFLNISVFFRKCFYVLNVFFPWTYK